MRQIHSVGKRDFIQHTSQYIKEAELTGSIIITHQNKPVLKLMRIEEETIHDLRGNITELKIEGDINDPILPGYDEW